MHGKVVVITGGSSGIGRAAALLFARRGASVVVAARGRDRGTQVVREIESCGGKAHAAAKAGVIALTKSAALEYASRGIRVNALVAGAFQTPMLEESMTRTTGGKPEAKKALAERYAQMVATGRIGRPEEAAEAAVWLFGRGFVRDRAFDDCRWRTDGGDALKL